MRYKSLFVFAMYGKPILIFHCFTKKETVSCIREYLKYNDVNYRSKSMRIYINSVSDSTICRYVSHCDIIDNIGDYFCIRIDSLAFLSGGIFYNIHKNKGQVLSENFMRMLISIKRKIIIEKLENEF